MKLASIKEKIKKGINRSTDRVLSARLRNELGINQPSLATLQTLSQGTDVDANLNSFFKPVSSTFLSSRDYKRIQNWALTFIIFVSLALMILFFSLILPSKDYSNALAGTQVLVKGKPLESKVVESKEVDTTEPNEELGIENIVLANAPTQELARRSPLVSKGSVTLMEYKIRSGDTLERVASKFYGSSSYENIQKIKTANKIANARLIQIGQSLIIPM